MRPVAFVSFALLSLSIHASATERAIVVLGARVMADGKPSAGLARRLETARTLAQHDPHAIVVVSGGTRNGQWPAEGPAMASWLKAHGVDGARIRVEGEASNTAENANLTLPILAHEGVSRVTVVTERYHMQRALFHMHAAVDEAGKHMRIEGAPAPDGLSTEQSAQMAIEERDKIARDRALRDKASKSAATVSP